MLCSGKGAAQLGGVALPPWPTCLPHQGAGRLPGAAHGMGGPQRWAAPCPGTTTPRPALALQADTVQRAGRSGKSKKSGCRALASAPGVGAPRGQVTPCGQPQTSSVGAPTLQASLPTRWARPRARGPHPTFLSRHPAWACSSPPLHPGRPPAPWSCPSDRGNRGTDRGESSLAAASRRPGPGGGAGQVRTVRSVCGVTSPRTAAGGLAPGGRGSRDSGEALPSGPHSQGRQGDWLLACAPAPPGSVPALGPQSFLEGLRCASPNPYKLEIRPQGPLMGRGWPEVTEQGGPAEPLPRLPLLRCPQGRS